MTEERIGGEETTGKKKPKKSLKRELMEDIIMIVFVSDNSLGDEKLCADQCCHSFGIDGRYDHDGRPDFRKPAVI